MANMSFFENMVENKLKNLHTAYLAKVLSVNGATAKIQPLGKTQAYNETAQVQSPLSNVPIATKKVVNGDTIQFVSDISISLEKEGETITDVKLNVTKSQLNVPKIENIAVGDIVIVVCCERDITEAKKGKNVVPSLGHHSMSSSVIVGVL